MHKHHFRNRQRALIDYRDALAYTGNRRDAYMLAIHMDELDDSIEDRDDGQDIDALLNWAQTA